MLEVQFIRDVRQAMTDYDTCMAVLAQDSTEFSSTAHTSSMKSTQGASLAAKLKAAFTWRTLSPNHLLVMLLGWMARKAAPHSAAAALASSVLPVPAWRQCDCFVRRIHCQAQLFSVKPEGRPRLSSHALTGR